MPTAWRRQAASVLVDEIFAWLQGADIHCVLVDMLNGLTDTLGSFQVTAIFWTVQASDYFRGKNHLDRFMSDPRENVDLQVPYDLLGIMLRPFSVFLGTGWPGAG